LKACDKMPNSLQAFATRKNPLATQFKKYSYEGLWPLTGKNRHERHEISTKINVKGNLHILSAQLFQRFALIGWNEFKTLQLKSK